MSGPTPSSSGSAKLRRTILACAHCRQRKVRCITTEQPPTNPCTRCKKKKLSCQYVSADPAAITPEHSPTRSTHSPDSDPDEPYASASAVSAAEGWAHMHNRRSRTPGPGTLSLPGSSFHDPRRSSLFSPTGVYPTPYRGPQRPLSALYDTQAIHARQYLDVRNAGTTTQSHPPMPMPPGRPADNYLIPTANYDPDPAQLQNDMLLDFWTTGHGGGHPWSNNPGSAYESGPWSSDSNRGNRHGGGFYPVED